VPEQLLTVLNLCVLALLYLFFFRVVRAVMTEVRDPTGTRSRRPRRGASARSEAKRPGAPLTPVATEPRTLAPVGGVGANVTLQSEMTIGRAPTCTIVISDDSYVSAVHARIHRRDGAWWVEDLGSTNGTVVNAAKITSPTALRLGDRLGVGAAEWLVA